MRSAPFSATTIPFVPASVATPRDAILPSLTGVGEAPALGVGITGSRRERWKRYNRLRCAVGKSALPFNASGTTVSWRGLVGDANHLAGQGPMSHIWPPPC